MRIAIIAPLLIEVPPKNFGFGAQEYIIHEIAEGLIRKNHEVTLFASGDSNTKGKLVSIIPQSLSNKPLKPFQRETYEIAQLSEAAAASEDFDVVNNHLLPYGLLFKHLFKAPVVHTLHHEIHKDNPNSVLYEQNKDSNFISISNSQRKVMPQLNYLSTIYNGVDTSTFSFKGRPEGDYFLCIGRMKRYKGIHIAIDLCKKLGLNLKIIAPMPKEGQHDFDEVYKYWEEELKPRIGGSIEYLGEVTGSQKIELLSNAKAMIFPVLREEPFGMTIVESMSCGTPVIAFERGAVLEIMEGLEDLMVTSEEEMEQELLRLNKMDEVSYLSLRKEVRGLVENKFNTQIMVEGYEEVLKKVAKLH